MDQFRTTVSMVFWTATPEESDAISAGLTAMLPSVDRPATLTSIEYVATGRPVTPSTDVIEPEEVTP